MSKKHTPGPWSVQPVTLDREVLYCVAQDKSPNNLAPQSRANARLIAAAPELLNAVKTLLRLELSNGNEADWWNAWRDLELVIAKAEGNE